MNNIKSALILDRLVFDKIEFNRKGFKNDTEPEFSIEAQIGVNDKNVYKVTLELKASKEQEYDLLICLSGFFTFDKDENLKDELKQKLINQNTVAILMPYIRSELSLLTAQPEMDCIVLPPFNINKILDEKNAM